MKKITVILLIICVVMTSSYAFAGTYYEGIEDGRRKAEQEHSSTSYWLVGLPASFFLTPLLGGTATIVTAYARTPDPDNRDLIQLEREDYSTDYVRGFEKGYQDAAKSSNTRAAWGATGVGFLARLAIIMASDDYTTSFDTNTYDDLSINQLEFEF